MKNNKGITLIALVITIIVLLILAGITIAMLTGENGLLNKANSAKVTDMKATADEKVNLAIAAMNLELKRNKVTNSSYTPVGDTNLTTDILSKDLIPSEDWTVPAVANGMEIIYKNTQFVKANNNKGRKYTLTVTPTKIELSGAPVDVSVE